MTAQLALHLEYRPAMDAEDFVVAPNNQEAVAWIDSWPDWPVTTVAIHGPAGCGKTHLMQVWRARTGAPLVRVPDLASAEPPEIIGNHAACAIDDADAGADERGLLHLHNILAERRGTLLLTAATPPSKWNVRLPDLRSRLLAASAIGISRPEERFMSALIVKLFADRQVPVGKEVADFLSVRLERSFGVARRVVEEVDRAALAARRPITVPFVRTLDVIDPGAGGEVPEL